MKKSLISLLLLLLPLTPMWDKNKPWPHGRKVTREVIRAIPGPKMPPLPGSKYLNTVPKYIEPQYLEPYKKQR